MKKIILLLFVSVMLSSCSNSDDSSSSSNDPIVGTWKIQSSYRIDADGNTIPMSIDDCDIDTRWIFNSNGTTIVNKYIPDMAGGSCTLNVADGTWTNPSGPSYVFEFGGPPSTEPTIVFSNSNNTMQMSNQYFEETLVGIWTRV